MKPEPHPVSLSFATWRNKLSKERVERMKWLDLRTAGTRNAGHREKSSAMHSADKDAGCSVNRTDSLPGYIRNSGAR